eukprot:s3499_g6.t1
MCAEVLPSHLGPDVEPTTWALEYKARNANAIKKEAVLEVLDSIAPKDRHKVNLNDPAKCIVVQVNAQWCGLSIVPHWAALKKYNLNALTTPQDTKDKNGTSPPASMCTIPCTCLAKPHPNLKKWCFAHFDFGNVLRATTACTFSTSQLPKALRR